MKKTTRKIAYSTLAFALSTVGALVCLRAEPVAADAAQTTPRDALITPQTYEEYLPLTAPTDAAVNGRYTAIADGNRIYVYDSLSNVYQTYTHGDGKRQDTVKKLQFSDDGHLYYADEATGDNFYKLNVETFAVTEIDDIACGTFTLQGENLYFTNASGSLYSTTLLAAERGEPKTPMLWDDISSLAVWNGDLYFVRADFYLHKIDPTVLETPDANKTQIATLSQVQSMTIANGTFAYTTVSGDFYALALPFGKDAPPLTHEQAGGYTALSAYEDNVYAIRQTAGVVRQYSTVEHKFTAKEICAASNADNRLDGATNLCLSDERLYIADDGNARVSVYNRALSQFEAPIRTNTAITHISADDDTLLTVNDTTATLYSLSQETYGAELATFSGFDGNLIGGTSVYGKYYLATDANFFYTLTQDQAGVWQHSEAIKNTAAAFTPKHITSDCYGTLYLASSANVYAYSETEFLDADASHSVAPKYDLPQGVKQIAVDYNQTVYALTDGEVYTLSENGYTPTDFSTPLVYVAETSLTSFAFGIEDNAAYLLYDGNYIAQTERLHLPTVNTVPVQNADENVFDGESAQDFSVLQTQENAFFVEIDLEKLNGAEYFPYLSYHRSEQAYTALKIGETDEYYLLAVFDKSTNGYNVYFTRKAFCAPLANDYRTDYETPVTGYITSEVALYKFPYLTELLTVCDLPRGTSVRLIGEITQLDYDYYHVSYTLDGAEKTGYIPQAYIHLFDGQPPATETVICGATESNNDSVWRLTYILLGFAIVCILTDYLLLRKKNQD
ncbi:MAG: hypothetical protein E7357_07385 [Clostridiales bacterium]|nr:hypothetical protein [Clostridiales bacterium]